MNVQLKVLKKKCITQVVAFFNQCYCSDNKLTDIRHFFEYLQTFLGVRFADFKVIYLNHWLN